MNDLFKTVNLLENKLSKLLERYTFLQNKNENLEQLNVSLEKQLKEKHQQLNDLEKVHESLRVANAMVGSKEDKHVTKLKINTLIREIDKCIVQLSD